MKRLDNLAASVCQAIDRYFDWIGCHWPCEPKLSNLTAWACILFGIFLILLCLPAIIWHKPWKPESHIRENHRTRNANVMHFRDIEENTNWQKEGF